MTSVVDQSHTPTPWLHAIRTCLALLLVLHFIYCTRGQPTRELMFQGSALGTTYNITIVGDQDPGQVKFRQAIERELEAIDRLMSTYREDSEISRFNRYAGDEPFKFSQLTFRVLSEAQAISKATNGAFDITVGALVKAWGFGPDQTDGIPDEIVLNKLRANTGWEKLQLSQQDSSALKNIPELQCDLSAIAKGYAVDRIAAALSQLGSSNYMIEVGGEIYVQGFNASGDAWKIGIERPNVSGRMVYRILPLTDTALATSGDYRNFHEIDGKRYSHIIDPRTGRPTEHTTVSVSVLASTAMRADAFATAILVLGEAEGLALAEREQLSVLLLIQDSDKGLRETASTRFRAIMRLEPQ